MMIPRKCTPLFFTVSLLISCSGDDKGNGPDPTQVPTVPTGLSAEPGDERATLSWNANTETTLSHYNIYQGSSADELVKVDEENDTSYEAHNLTNGTTYYFAIDAETTNGDVSGLTATVSAVPVSASATVYVAGHEGNGANQVAKLWVNGIPQILSEIPNDTYALSVFVAGENVYVAGRESTAGVNSKATLWVNGSPQYLTDGSTPSSANSVFVDDGNVYVAGFEVNSENISVAMLWKNGEPHPLTNGQDAAMAFSVFVDGNKVYVAGSENKDYPVGSENEGTSYPEAKLWEMAPNGAIQAETLSTDFSVAYSVFVDNGDVYIAGYRQAEIGTDFLARLWKNGVGQAFLNQQDNGVGRAVSVDGGDIYVAGNENLPGTYIEAKLWKSNTVHFSSENLISSGSSSSEAFSVFVDNGDVYVAGRANATKATLWKNGTPHFLTDGQYPAIAWSVFVKH